MRKLLILAALAAVALGGAACATTPSAPLPGSSTSAAASDQTKQVCADAQSANTAAIATLQQKLTEGQQAFLAGDAAKVSAAQSAALSTITSWTANLTTLSQKPIKPSVKQVLTDGITTINGLAASMATTSQADAQTKLTDFTTKLATACAGA
jgi:hypothetical protein